MDVDHASSSEGHYRLKGKDLIYLQSQAGAPSFPALDPEVEERLSRLAQLADTLQIDDLSLSSYAGAISQLSREELELKRELSRLEHCERLLQAHLSSTLHKKHLLDKHIQSLTEELDTTEDTDALHRRKEALIAKAKGHQLELQALKASTSDKPVVTVTQLMQEQERLKALDQDLKAKRAKLRAFQGLPPNLDLARLELQTARAEQAKLFQLRERLLRSMADGVA